MNLTEACEHYGVCEWGRSAPLAVRILRGCDEVDGCWRRRTVLNTGYSLVSRRGAAPVLAHRAMYELMVGPIPDGLEIDHLCRNRACCNPAHLEPVTEQTNTLRGTSPAAVNAAKTHCQNGHEFTPENTYVVRSTKKTRDGRGCKTCRREYLRAWRAARALTPRLQP